MNERNGAAEKTASRAGFFATGSEGESAIERDQKRKLNEARLVALRQRLRCIECGHVWPNEEERWRSYLTDDAEPALYCADCAVKEFDS